MYRMQVKLYGMLNIYIMDVNKKKTSDLSLKCFYTVYKNKTIASKPKQISLVQAMRALPTTVVQQLLSPGEQAIVSLRSSVTKIKVMIELN